MLMTPTSPILSVGRSPGNRRAPFFMRLDKPRSTMYKYSMTHSMTLLRYLLRYLLIFASAYLAAKLLQFLVAWVALSAYTGEAPKLYWKG